MKRCPNGHDVADKSNYCFTCNVSVPYIRESRCKNGHLNSKNYRWCSECEARIPIVESDGYVSLNDSEDESNFQDQLVSYDDGWPVIHIEGLEISDLQSGAKHDLGLADAEKILGVMSGRFNQAIVATDLRVMVAKSGLLSGSVMGGQVTSFDYRNIVGIEVRKGMKQCEFEILSSGLNLSDRNKLLPGVNVFGVKRSIRESPNIVVFFDSALIHFQAMANKIRERTASTYIAHPVTPSESISNLLMQLAELHESGVLTDDEFTAKKVELLGRM